MVSDAIFQVKIRLAGIFFPVTQSTAIILPVFMERISQSPTVFFESWFEILRFGGISQLHSCDFITIVSQRRNSELACAKPACMRNAKPRVVVIFFILQERMTSSLHVL